MATTYLTATQGTPTNSKKCTVSVWLKRTGLAADTSTGTFFAGVNTSDTTDNGFINFNPNDKIFIQSSLNDSNKLGFVTTRVFQDSSSWYHVVVAFDTTQSTSTDRVKIYINGVQETLFDAATYPDLNLDLPFSLSGLQFQLGKYPTANDAYFNGLASHYNFIDGTAYAPTEFGETDSTTGEWKIKTSLSVTYGNNGFFILKDGNSVTDQSGNSNNFTVASGALTKTEDNPSNVFCTFNTLNKSQSNLTLTNGSTTLTSTASGWFGSCGTLGFQKGFATYFEAKAKTIVYALTWGLSRIGEGTNGTPLINPPENDSGYDYMTRPTSANTIYYKGANQNVTVSAIAAGDILSCLISASGVVKFYINDSLTHTYSQVLLDNSFYFPVAGANGSSQGWDFNFGNGYFGTTAVASAGINASGNGIFEYDIPSGTTALSTKGLNL